MGAVPHTAHGSGSAWLSARRTAKGLIEMSQRSRSVKVTDHEAWRGSKLRARDQDPGGCGHDEEKDPPGRAAAERRARPACRDSLPPSLPAWRALRRPAPGTGAQALGSTWSSPGKGPALAQTSADTEPCWPLSVCVCVCTCVHGHVGRVREMQGHVRRSRAPRPPRTTRTSPVRCDLTSKGRVIRSGPLGSWP